MEKEKSEKKEVMTIGAPPEDSFYKHWQKLIKDKPSVPGGAVSYQFLPPPRILGRVG